MLRPSRTILEVEIKLPIRDATVAALIQDRLRRLGARPRLRVLEQNTLYDTPGSDFRHSGRFLRLRTETTQDREITALLTAKAPPDISQARTAKRSRYKERLESEVRLTTPAVFARRLGALGLRPAFSYEKYRTSFELPGLHIALDETPVGIFLELEGRPAAIDRAARALGFQPRHYYRGTYWDLYVSHCRRKGLRRRNMLLSRKKSQ